MLPGLWAILKWRTSETAFPAFGSTINQFTQPRTYSEFSMFLWQPVTHRVRLYKVCCTNSIMKGLNIGFIAYRVVASQLAKHMAQFDLHEPHQSVYRPHHSCETALIRVQNKILWAMNHRKVGILLLLDLSAAFDTVSHDVLLQQLAMEMGVCGKALTRFESYLTNHQQRMSLVHVASEPCTIKFGVPQGSVLGPQLFSIYTKPLGRIIRSHWLDYDFYADDSQLFIFVRPLQALVDGAVDMVHLCVQDIRIWMRNHFLKLNDSKTEVLVVGSRQQVAKVKIPGVTVGNALILPSARMRNLGAVFDTEMTMINHINAVCRSVCLQVRNIGRIHRSLSADTCKQIVHTSVTSRLDFCNSLLVGIPESTVGKLQRCQNIAACIISRTKKHKHVTPVLKELHWLPVVHRVHFKVLLQVYKALHGLVPRYVADLIQPYWPTALSSSSLCDWWSFAAWT